MDVKRLAFGDGWKKYNVININFGRSETIVNYSVLYEITQDIAQLDVAFVTRGLP